MLGSKFATLILMGLTLALLVQASPIRAQEEQPDTPTDPVDSSVAEAEEAVASKVKAYQEAFNAGNLEKLISLWTPEGVYINRSTAEVVRGRPALLDQMKAIHGSDPKPQIELATESIQLISPNVVLERGLAKVTRNEDEISESRYQSVFVNVSGDWLLDRVTEENIIVAITNSQRLEPLDWLIGEWVDDDEVTRIEVTCNWTKNQNFISRKFAIYENEEVISSGLEIVGWDPLQEQIHSWLFDSEGTVVEGVWTQREDEWVVQSIATFVDGARGSYTAIYKPQDDGNCTFMKTNQVVDGAIMPNTDQILMIRQQ